MPLFGVDICSLSGNFPILSDKIFKQAKYVASDNLFVDVPPKFKKLINCCSNAVLGSDNDFLVLFLKKLIIFTPFTAQRIVHTFARVGSHSFQNKFLKNNFKTCTSYSDLLQTYPPTINKHPKTIYPRGLINK